MNIKKQLGVSLVGLMIGTSLGIFLAGVTGTVYLGSKRAYAMADTVANMHENGRFALGIVSEDLRQAGFWGNAISAIDVIIDANVATPTNDCNNMAAAKNLNSHIWSFTATSNFALGCITNARIDTDVLVVKHVSGNGIDPTTTNPIANTNYIVANHAIAVLLPSAQVSAATVAPGGVVPGGLAWEYQNYIYYVNNNAVPQLVRKRLAGNVWQDEVVADGIEDLHVVFGVDSDGNPGVDRYESSVNVSNWQQVVSSKLFVRSRTLNTDAGFTNLNSYQYGLRANFTPNDNIRRELFTTNVNIVNNQLNLTGAL